jgi:multidrug/hemolysin transport system permease protein
MRYFISRNLKIFFRDKSAVFFSLLAVFIIIALYVMFLGDMVASSVPNVENSRFLMDSWIMAGLLAVISITTTMGAFEIMVNDKSRNISKDFYSAPLKRSAIGGGYIISAFIIGIIMSLVALLLVELYIVSGGGSILPLSSLLQVLVLILLSVVSSSSIVFFLVSFFKSQNAFSTAATIIGTLIGFLTGIYIPISALPESVRLVIKIFPVSHSAVLFRQIFMKVPIALAFEGAPQQTVSSFKESLGVVFRFGETTVSPLASIIYLIFTAVLFFTLAVLNLSRKSRN